MASTIKEPEEHEVHSHIGASSAYRWMNCPGSVRLLQLVTAHSTSEYAELGTAAHALCELCLRNGHDPSLYDGVSITVGGRDIPVDDAMIDSVSVYYNAVMKDYTEFGGKLNVEESFDLSWIYRGMFGRNDSSIVPAKAGGTLFVYDYKHGKKAVAAEDNPQLKYYALGALGPGNPLMVEKVVCKIIQPNCWGKDPVDVWTTTPDDLYAWGYDVLAPAAALTEDPAAPCNPGSWCHFCEAGGMCPARAAEALALLDATPEQPVETIKLPATELLTPEQLGRMCNVFLSDEFSTWLKSLAAAEFSLLQRQVDVPGRKLIEQTSTGNRKWDNEVAATRALVQQFGEDVLDTRLKSPAQMEKLLASLGVPKAERSGYIDPYVTRKEATRLVVVPATDARPSVANIGDDDIKLFD